jgi:hypothetical protein
LSREENSTSTEPALTRNQPEGSAVKGLDDKRLEERIALNGLGELGQSLLVEDFALTFRGDFDVVRVEEDEGILRRCGIALGG